MNYTPEQILEHYQKTPPKDWQDLIERIEFLLAWMKATQQHLEQGKRPPGPQGQQQ